MIGLTNYDPAISLQIANLSNETCCYTFKSYYKSKKEGKDQEFIQSSTTPDPGYQRESNNLKIRHHKREPRGHPSPSRRPQGINAHKSITNTRQKYNE